MALCPGNVNHSLVLCFLLDGTALPVVLCPGDLEALLWVGLEGGAATAPGRPGPEMEADQVPSAGPGAADLGAARREQSQKQQR